VGTKCCERDSMCDSVCVCVCVYVYVSALLLQNVSLFASHTIYMYKHGIHIQMLFLYTQRENEESSPLWSNASCR